MIIGELILKGETVYTPPLMRGGSRGVFSVRALQVFSSPSLDVIVENKNLDENADNDWTARATMTILAATEVAKFVSDLEEQVRLKFVMGTSGNQAARVFIYEPSWEP